MKKIILITIMLSALFSLTSCNSDADIASRNISKAADQFEIERRVVFYNGITGDYILSIEGKCSIGSTGGTSDATSISGGVTITCKVGEKKYKKHFLGLSDNVTYFAEQLESKDVSLYHYRVIFKPQSIIPDIDFKGSTNDIPKFE